MNQQRSRRFRAAKDAAEAVRMLILILNARDSYAFCDEVWVIVLMWPYRKLKRKGWGKNLRVRQTFCLLKTSVRLQTLMSLPLELNLWQPCQWLSSIIYRLGWTTILAGGIQRCNWRLIQLILYISWYLQDGSFLSVE